MTNDDDLLVKLADDLSFANFRSLFYAVTPNETTYENIHDVPNYIEKASLWFLILFMMEFVVIWLKGMKNGFALNDTITSLNAGVLSQLVKLAIKSTVFWLYVYVYENYRLIDMPIASKWTWIFCFFAEDLAYYCGHRAVHEAGIFWSFHQTHHSSEYYNLSTALRQGAFQTIGTAVFDVMQSFFIPPPLFYLHRQLNTLYQFWIHTELIPHLGPLEFILNTPSHHRVHHGRNAYCIDKNYAGTLIIWDRLFGTFEAERQEEKSVYGLVDNVKTFDQLWVQLFEFKALGYDKGQMRDENGKELFPGFWNKVRAATFPPGYFPGVQVKRFFWWLCVADSEEGIPKIEDPVVKYNPKIGKRANYYVLVQFLVMLISYMGYVRIYSTLTGMDIMLQTGYIIATMQVCGAFFDKKPNARTMEIYRQIGIAIFLLVTFNLKMLVITGASLIYLFYYL